MLKARVSAQEMNVLRHSVVTLCDPRDCSPPGFSVRRILQARILEWVALRKLFTSFRRVRPTDPSSHSDT